jgi:hypothetical protein
MVDLTNRLEGYPVKLNVLSRGDVQQATPPALADSRDDVELLRRQQATRDLDSLHVARVVELVVEPVRKADRPKLLRADPATPKGVDSIGMLIDRAMQELARQHRRVP